MKGLASWEAIEMSSPTELAFHEDFWREELEPRFFSFFFDHAKKESKVSTERLLYREMPFENQRIKKDVMANSFQHLHH